MFRTAAGIIIVLATSAMTAQPLPPKTETWTGWFSDKQCARVRPGEAPRPNGTACVQKCLNEGVPAVFISEQAKGVFEVLDYPSVKGDVGWYVQITGEVNASNGTVSVQSVKRLSEVTALCVLPKKGTM